MQQITVSLGQRSYPIEIGPGLLREARRRLEALPVKRWADIADDNTAALYAGALDLPVYTFPAGEGSKRLAVYSEFAPEEMSEDEIKNTIQAVLSELGIAEPSARDKGKVMKELMPRVKGRADGSLVNRIVGELLK